MDNQALINLTNTYFRENGNKSARTMDIAEYIKKRTGWPEDALTISREIVSAIHNGVMSDFSVVRAK